MKIAVIIASLVILSLLLFFGIAALIVGKRCDGEMSKYNDTERRENENIKKT